MVASRDNLKAEITAVDWDIIRRIKSHPAVTIPVVANGGVADVTDVRACLDYTGADRSHVFRRHFWRTRRFSQVGAFVRQFLHENTSRSPLNTALTLDVPRVT